MKTIKEIVDSLPLEEIKKQYYEEFNNHVDRFAKRHNMPEEFKEPLKKEIMDTDVDNFLSACTKSFDLTKTKKGTEFWIVGCFLVDTYLRLSKRVDDIEASELLEKIKKECENEFN